MINMTISGVYWIRNITNDHIYIGSSTDILGKVYHHFHCLRHNCHCNSHLQRAYNRYGEGCFVYAVIWKCDPDEVLWYEQQFIDQLVPEYNMSEIAGKVEMTDSVRHKISEAQKGVPRTYMLGTQHAKGFRWSDEDKRKISEHSKGRKHSEDTKHKISVSMIGNQHSKGFRWSDEDKRKISERMRGNRNSTGRKLSEQHKERIRQAHLKRNGKV